MVEDSNMEIKRKKKKGEPRDFIDCVPNPIDISKLNQISNELGFKDFTILNRLTVIFSNQDNLHKILKSPNYKKYHIVASLPTSTAAFMFTCSNFDADILTIDPQNKTNIKLNRKLYNQLIEKGCHFELLYSPAIEDSTKRKNLIYTSHLYHSIGKSKNVIFSSGAQDSMLLRSPYDVISLGFIFGLGELQCKASISHCPQRVVINSVGRIHGKSVMFIENTQNERDISLITLSSSDSEEEEMDTKPVQKKCKQ
ncbi:ribonuclease P protein subunit p30 isoform X2 [Cylas formicarius]|nr:ribonuclease P protein subunit p30 isoform X2 [Cylas formicarius]